MSTITVALVVFLIIHETSGIGPRCQCISREKRPIGRYIGVVEVNLASSHCSDMEIIATLKQDGQKVCLDPNAPWVKKVLEKKNIRQKP